MIIAGTWFYGVGVGSGVGVGVVGKHICKHNDSV